MKPKIFIIEDEPDIIDLYRMTFEENGLELESAATGNKGLERLNAFAKNEAPKPDFILLDLMLPDMSGISILREFQKMDTIKNIPIIILTNYASEEVQRFTDEFKDMAYLIKAEVTPQQLADILKQKLNFKQ